MPQGPRPHAYQTPHDRESEFHDRWADATRADQVQVHAAFDAITAIENRFILSLIGGLKGKKVLDVGAGLGESAVYFALAGAEVTAVDLSPKMVRLCQEIAKRHGVEIEGVVSAAEDLRVDAETYDVVYVANLLHHVPDKEPFLRRIFSALKPGGLFLAWDPIKYNPIINVYRRLAHRVRTADEMPLGQADLELSRRIFPDLQHREFWFFTLALFLKYFAIDRYDPNKVRYWKRILKETPESIGWWFTPLAKLDSLVLRLPAARWLAWNTVQWGLRPVG